MKVEYLPFITIGLITLNREWIVGDMLDSLFSQSYPMEKIYLVVVDGGSTDGTVDVIRNKVKNSKIYGHEIVITQPSIPEQRNLCIDMAKGEVLVFWDSDEIMDKMALERLVKVVIDRRADIAAALGKIIFLNSLDELSQSVKTSFEEVNINSDDDIVEFPSLGMGHTAISKSVFDSGIRFDPELTWAEDFDFGLRAREKGFKIVQVKNVLGLDIKMKKVSYSDIYVDMPLNMSIKALPKKARVQLLGSTSEVTFNYFINFYRNNIRYIYYLGYPLMLILSIYGFIKNNVFFLISFPIYLLIYFLFQTKRRGMKKGLKMILRSIIVGIPFSYFQLYYLIKYIIINLIS